MTPEERLDRMEQILDRHIQFVGETLIELAKQVNRTAAAQEVTEAALQKLIERVDHHEERLQRLEPKEPRQKP